MKIKVAIPWALGLGLLMETVDTTVLNTAIPQMARSFQVDPLTMKLAIVSYLLTLAIFIPISGYLAERYGAKKIFLLAISLFLVSSLLCGLSTSLPSLVIGRLLQGIGGAMMTPVGRLLLLNLFSGAEFVQAFSSLALIGQIGVVLGPPLGGALTSWLSWRWVFFINLPIGGLALLLAAFLLPKDISMQKHKFDWTGFVLFSISISFITIACALTTENVLSYLSIGGLLFLTGTLLLYAYLKHALRAQKPLLNPALFRINTFKIATLGSFVIRLAINAPVFLLMLLFQMVFEFTPLQAGFLFLPYGTAMLLAKFLIKKQLYRYGFKHCLMLNITLLCLLFFELSFLTKNTPISMLLLLSGLLGFLSSTQFTLMNMLTFADVSKHDHPQATSLSSVMQQLAMNFSVCLSAMLLPLLGHWHNIANMSILNFRHTWIILSMIIFFSLLIFSRLNREDGHRLLRP